MRYGFDFQFGVYESLKKLCKERPNGEVTVTEVLNFYITENELHPTTSYKKTLRNRVWRFLREMVDAERVLVDHRKHETRNNLIGFYKLKQ